jgi:hypothetical protein
MRNILAVIKDFFAQLAIVLTGDPHDF